MFSFQSFHDKQITPIDIFLRGKYETHESQTALLPSTRFPLWAQASSTCAVKWADAFRLSPRYEAHRSQTSSERALCSRSYIRLVTVLIIRSPSSSPGFVPPRRTSKVRFFHEKFFQFGWPPSGLCNIYSQCKEIWLKVFKFNSVFVRIQEERRFLIH